MKYTILALAAALMTTCLTGCEDSPDVKTTESQLINVQRENLDLKAEVTELKSRVAQQNEQITTLQSLGPVNMDELFLTNGIKMGKFTGGWDFDGDDVEDGIKVFITPFDQYDSLLKSAGSATVQIYNLNADPTEVLLAEFHWTAAEMADLWATGFMGSHYTMDCPWPDGVAPDADDVTVRVAFIDSLTGKTFRAQKLCPINREPAADAEAAPAAQAETEAPTQ